ncbi:MAG: C69 family dipeptidase [Synergistaceae bacterium]|jgi:dipeptidase|nr:C69 family dipeptidase [Synergistaceae bacterium]
MWWLLAVIGAALSMAAAPSFACTTVLVGKNASATGEVLVGHNEDSGGRYVMKTHLVPAEARVAVTGAEDISETTLRFEPEAALLAPSRERPKLFWSEARPFVADGGASFCDLYVNGYGVVLCSDNCGKSREDRPDLTDGGIGYGVRRLTAERGRSAYNAVEVASGLIDKYGYIGSGRGYHFADKNEIWVLQVVNGKHYAVKRVEDDEIYVNPNHYTIRQPDPHGPGFENSVSYAIQRGWHDPRRGEFDFARSYQAPDAYCAARNIHRHRRGLEILLDRDVPETDLPFSVKHTRKIGIEDIKKVLRCHFENTPQDVSGGGTPHFMRTRPMCVSTTLESTIVQIRENHDMTLIWRALGRPCLTPYSPWYFGIAKVPDQYAGDPEEALKTHFAVPAADLDYSKDEAWFHYTDLQAAMDPLYGEKAAEIQEAAVAEFEANLRDEVRYFEPLAREHFNRDPEKARGLLTGSVADWSERTLRKLDELYAKAGVLPIELPGEIETDAQPGKSFSVRVAVHDAGFAAENLILEKTRLGPHYVPCVKWSRVARVESLEKEEEKEKEKEKLRLFFTAGEWGKDSVPCLTDMWLILENKEGRRLVGKGLTALRRESRPQIDEPCDCV